MTFNSVQYLVFFPIVATLYFLLPHRFRWMMLLVASYIFYMAWEPFYIVLILASTIIDYLAGRALAITDKPRRRFLCLLCSIATNLGLLFAFKYFNFATRILAELSLTLGIDFTPPEWRVLLPVGISFYTFQTLSYTIDVYWGKQPTERHAGIFALYVAFFPQLVAGPIERPGHLLPQFRKHHSFDYFRAVSGLRLILWGLFKKVVVADSMALFVNPVYEDPGNFPAPILALATVAFAVQIYGDFSGYSDIAIGSARVLGFSLMKNFDRPYAARSIRDFWHRWHISLSTWFRDYLYIPLGGNRAAGLRWCLNIFLVFAISGVWHGANETFVVWGALHGLYFLVGAALAAPYNRFTGLLPDVLRKTAVPLFERIVTFVLVCFAWVFFRAQSIGDALEICTRIVLESGSYLSTRWIPAAMGLVELAPLEIAAVLACVLVTFLVEAFQGDEDQSLVFERMPLLLRRAAYLFLGLALLRLSVPQEIPFIYFQF
ncbi:MAG: O-acyltransferase [Candidatus Hydrogenedentota bacterium]